MVYKKHSKEDLKSQIEVYNHQVFKGDDKTTKINSHSWFNIEKTNNIFQEKEINIKEENYLTARKYLLKPTNEQKKILRKMFIENIKMYNETLKLIKKDKKYKKLPSYFTLMKEMKNKKNEIKNISPSHVLDKTIRKALTNYKSAISNQKVGHIKKFRIRYYKFKKNIKKQLFFEPCYVKKNGSITNLGHLKVFDLETKKEYKIKKENINHEFIISFSERNYYVILLFDDKISEKVVKREEFISLDPGVSPFLTGVSKDNYYIFGKDGSDRIKKINNKIDDINNKDIKERKRKLLLNKLRKKIKNLVNDFHWKTISFLTNNFETILIGDMSSKRCLESRRLKKITKRTLNSLSFFKFKQRLEWKSKLNNNQFKEINEYFTSKTCSLCGCYKPDLGFDKVYNCKECKKEINRDLNGARNIYFVSKIK